MASGQVKHAWTQAEEMALVQFIALHRDLQVWLKLDATDIKQGLFEGKGGGDWHGDADTGDGTLLALRLEYDRRLGLVTNITPDKISDLLMDLSEDKIFLAKGIEEAAKEFQGKMSKNTTDNKLKELSWNLVEFQTLLDQCQALQAKLHELADRFYTQQCTQVAVCVALKRLTPDLKIYLRNVFKKKRTPATHIMVFMLSSEKRAKKPYAVPVWYLPYKSVQDSTVRTWTNQLKEAMLSSGINIAGTVTDGEFATLRYSGEKRPLHLFIVKQTARKAVANLSETTLQDMLQPVGVDETMTKVVVKKPDAAICNNLLSDIFISMEKDNKTFEQAIYEVWQNLAPSGYTPFPFVKYNDVSTESHTDRMKTIVASYKFRSAVETYSADGVDFLHCLYVPEVDSITGKVHHERADHNHLLKRIASAVRQGRDPRLNLEAFDKAMLAESTGLTHAALVGVRKQSVPDAERLLSYQVASFMEKNGFSYEAEYVKTIAQWHEASDGRGLNQETRHQYNMNMLEWLRQDFHPWFREDMDYHRLDVNRPIDNIRGLTRETILEITTNIESQEHRREQNVQIGYAEHPRAATTDDVEAFFSICRRQLGQSFTLKDAETAWPKIVQELCKQLDENLPFYYHPARDYDEDLGSFDDPQDKNTLRLHNLKVNQREDSSVFVAGRSFLPVRNKPSLRHRLHNPEGPLPPVPNHMKLEL